MTADAPATLPPLSNEALDELARLEKTASEAIDRDYLPSAMSHEDAKLWEVIRPAAPQLIAAARLLSKAGEMLESLARDAEPYANAPHFKAVIPIDVEQLRAAANLSREIAKLTKGESA